MSFIKKARIAPILAASVLLASCGQSGGGETAKPVAGGPVAPAPAKTFAEAVTRAEAAGSIPVLDRGTSVPGTDANADGVRDDIEKYINSLPDTEAQKTALRQTARAFGAVLTADPQSQSALNAASAKLSNASSCVFSQYPDALASKRAHEIEQFYVNTQQRFDAYNSFNEATSGTTSLSPVGSGCEN